MTLAIALLSVKLHIIWRKSEKRITRTMTATLMIRINIRLFNSFLFCSLCSSFSLSRWFLFLFFCRWISLCPIPCVCRNEYLIETIQSHAMPLNWNRFISFIRLSCSLSWRSFFSGAFLSVIGRNGDKRHFFSLKTLFLLHSSVTAIVLIKYQRFLHSFFSFSQICRIMVQFQFDDTHTQTNSAKIKLHDCHSNDFLFNISIEWMNDKFVGIWQCIQSWEWLLPIRWNSVSFNTAN